MWRFITVTFAFLGWSFYVLSGGADYEPRTNSIQARALLDDVRPLARPGSVIVATAEEVEETPSAETAALTDEDLAVTRALTTLSDLDIPKDQVQLTLAAVSPAEVNEPEFEADAQKVETLTQTPEIVPEAPAPTPADLREVTGTVVNMRDGPSTFYLTIGQLRQGDQVEVLDNPGEGWLKIRVTDTGQEGWMADWLVTAAAAN